MFDFDDDDGEGIQREAECRDCHSKDVYWAQDSSGKWHLYDLNSRRHRCSAEHVTADRLDAFENMD